MSNWEKELSDEYVLLFRTHPFTTHFTVTFNDFVRNVTLYENLNYLLAITDILITDYSTIIYDCVIAQKPFICFGYDYDTYCEERGFYFDLNTTYPGGVCKTEAELFARLRYLERADSLTEYEQFRDTYVQAGGNATEQVIQELAARIREEM
jgi:CDP-glycerol glycerophosphotransferase